MSNKDGVALSFHDILLHDSDIDLLRGPAWLNDNLISFYFEYLEKVQYKDNDDIAFVSPEVTQCLKVSPVDEIPVFLDPLHVKERSFVILAVNDCVMLESPGGSHWSLLAYSRPEDTFFHFDSSVGSNRNHASGLAKKLASYLNPNSRFEFIETQCLQQSNCYDCGIHVIAQAELIAKYVTDHKKIHGCNMLSRGVVANKREEMLELITNLQRQP